MAMIVVAGAIANRPGNGGGAWVRLNWMLGLIRLGHTVHFVEQIDHTACVDSAGRAARFKESANLAYFRAVTRAFHIPATLILGSGEQCDGLEFARLAELGASADLLVNLGGHLRIPALFDRFRRKVYVDLDPGFTQFWHSAGTAGPAIAGHGAYFTVGTNIGTVRCEIPTNGIAWRPIRPPVVLDQWPVAIRPDRRFTTVASWRGAFGPLEYAGKTYGVKVHEFRKFLELPARTRLSFEIALSIHPDDARDQEALQARGWRVASPTMCETPELFREYVAGSGAEFSAAQGVYVNTRSGWFSDRTACYLAAGKPGLVQDTGIHDIFFGEGLLTFQTLDEAVAGAAAIHSEYDRHSRAARRLAEEWFDSDRVLGHFLREVGVAP